MIVAQQLLFESYDNRQILYVVAEACNSDLYLNILCLSISFFPPLPLYGKKYIYIKSSIKGHLSKANLYAIVYVSLIFVSEYYSFVTEIDCTVSGSGPCSTDDGFH